MIVYISVFGLFKSLPELILIRFIVTSVKRHFLNILGASLTEIAFVFQKFVFRLTLGANT